MERDGIRVDVEGGPLDAPAAPGLKLERVRLTVTDGGRTTVIGGDVQKMAITVHDVESILESQDVLRLAAAYDSHAADAPPVPLGSGRRMLVLTRR